MPTYSYQCSNCKGVIDKFFKISEKPQEFEERCPNCNLVSTFSHIISPVGFLYLGFNHSAKVPTDLKNRFDQIRKHYPNMESSI